MEMLGTPQHSHFLLLCKRWGCVDFCHFSPKVHSRVIWKWERSKRGTDFYTTERCVSVIRGVPVSATSSLIAFRIQWNAYSPFAGNEAVVFYFCKFLFLSQLLANLTDIYAFLGLLLKSKFLLSLFQGFNLIWPWQKIIFPRIFTDNKHV